MQADKFPQQLVQQEIALDSYLSTLLDEIPTNLELDQLDQENEKVKQVELKLKSRPTIVEQGTNKEAELTAVENPLSVMPSWAQDEFQALFFKVDKLTLVIPLTELLRMIKIEKQPSKLPGQPTWFMGLLESHGQQVGILDTGQLILGKSRGQQRNLEQQPFQSILITHDGKWGLACDEILSIGKIEPDQVRWRTLRQKRPWLVGTVIEELTAVIDVNHLVPHRKAS